VTLLRHFDFSEIDFRPQNQNIRNVHKKTSKSINSISTMRIHSSMKFLAAATTAALLVAVTNAFGVAPLVVRPHVRLSTTATTTTARSKTTAIFVSTENTQDSNKASIPNTIIKVNPLIAGIQPSKTVEIFSLVKQMQADGIAVTSLCVGEPDFLPAPAVLEAVVQAVAAGDTKYTAITGTAALRQAIAADLARRKGVKYDWKTEIVVGNGAKQCVYQGILAVAGAGDAVLVPAPYWPSYPEMVAMAGATPVIVPTDADTGYLLTAAQLRAALQEHGDAVKLLILCNPSNPTGGVYSAEHLSELTEVLLDFPHVAVLADEIYERLVYSTEKDACPSFAAQPGMFHRTLTVNGFSKAYAMTGLRLGYLAAPAHLARAVTTIQSQLTSCAGSLSQAAGVAALTLVTDEELQQNVEIMRHKRDYVLEQLATMPGVHVAVPPAGAFYVLPNVEGYYNGDDNELCMDLLKSKKLALVPGSSFGAPGTVRISYATSMEELEEAMDKLRSFLQERKVQEEGASP
jgi:aspartate/methionine/tyrosine aminotransferase